MVVVIQHEQGSEERSARPSSGGGDNKDASDGFETASDADLGSGGDDDGGDASTRGGDASEEQHRRQEHEQPQQQQQQEVEPEQGIPQTSEFSQDVSNMEELGQKALAQANEVKVEGNKLFGDGQYEEAISQYELALQVAPDMPSSVEIR